MSTVSTEPTQERPSPLREIVQPFIDLMHAPRALWGINVGYFLEGLVYFGFVGYLALYFSEYVFGGMEGADVYAHDMVAVLTAGITISMFFLGTVPDRVGVRRALVAAFLLLLAGRILISAAPTILGLKPAGLGSPLQYVTLVGIILVVVGYGMYQPAAYAGVRQFTTSKTAPMGFAMLYALMNLGGYFPTYAFMLRDEKWMGIGYTGVFWVYTGLTVVALIATAVLLSKSTVARAIAEAKAERAAEAPKVEAAAAAVAAPRLKAGERLTIPLHMIVAFAVVLGMVYWRVPAPTSYIIIGVLAAAGVASMFIPGPSGQPLSNFLANHPLADAKFFFFIFALIPVQTLFTYNWLVLPSYIARSYQGWIGEYFEVASNLNPILIFILVPIITAATQKAPVYRMMILGTTVMAAPAFLLALGANAWTLFGYILIMTVGEAMWQPRFLQYAAEIAPEGRTGEYMGVAQLPWFLTKLLVPLLYSGYMMDRYCPAEGSRNTEYMWLIFGCIAITSPILLLLAKNWIGKDFKTKHAA